MPKGTPKVPRPKPDPDYKWEGTMMMPSGNIVPKGKTNPAWRRP